MLSQMNLRFPKSLIAALKNRAAAEAVPVNTLAERLLQQMLATSVAGDEYRALCAASYTTLGQLYRKVVGAETVDGQALSCAELRWLFTQAQIAYRDGRGPVNRAPLSALLLITDALLEMAVGGGLDVDPHYYRQTFGLRGEDWLQALRDRFTATLTPPAGSAEFFARPLASGVLNLDDFSGAVFQSTFTWPVFAELHCLLVARRDGDRTRSCQGRHVLLHVPESGDIGLVLPNLLLRRVPGTFTALEADLMGQLEHSAATAALAELAALYGAL
ncbi:hypothetical protein QRZ34_27830 [Klebsiella michiganensis]|uniref:hypothetical protein n=1 Tax=Klebsiella michiganensis TaxID=1134687 RepID=UPI0025703151|nr:hypothetical protein [Klebsiella michiganensis]MDL4454832.1 hypothetical protein [Klebsiella michiganensis]